MFDHSITKSSDKSTFSPRLIVYISLGIIVVLGLITGITYRALAVQSDNTPQKSNLLTDLSVVEEIDLGNQGIFPAGDTLATVHVDGDVYTLDMEGVDVSDEETAYGVTLSNEDYIEEKENEYGYDVYVNRLIVETSEEEVEIPFETEYVADDTMSKGEEVVTTEGQNGVETNTYEVRTLNGETTTELVSTDVTVEPVNEVITYGTYTGTPTGFVNHGSSLDLTSETVVAIDTENQTFTLSSGETVSYSSKLTCTGYAYCTGTRTFTGTAARQGEVAVDPSVIPLGSKLFIITSDGSVVYGYATAEDTGGNIKGHKVDLFYNSRSMCINFGSREIMVFILD